MKASNKFLIPVLILAALMPVFGQQILTRGPALIGGDLYLGGNLNLASTATLELNSLICSAAAGDKALNVGITQVAGTALTGNLIGLASVATNGTTAASTGVIYGAEIKARAATSGGTGATIGRLDGVYASVDAKTKTATIMRAFEASLDGGAGGTSTEAVAFEAFNNSSATQTASYAFSANGGTASGHKVYTADFRMQNGALFDNAVDGVLEWNEASDELKATFGSNTVTLSSTDVTAFNFGGGISTTWAGSTSGGIKVAPIATGTAVATIQNQNVAASTITLPSATCTLPGLGLANSWSASQTLTGTSYLELDGATSGGIKLLPLATGTALTTISNQNVAAATITLPSATTTLPGLSLANVWTGANTLNNDLVLALGTTATNAETQITAEFDETTTGIGLLRIGDLSNPQVLNTNPGATVVGSIVNINHSAGAGDCDDLLGEYNKVNVIGSGDAGLTAVASAPRAYVGLTGGANNSVASQVYASQPWFRHGGTGAITAGSALSAKCDVGAENFTATTINAGHFHIDGAGDVTGQYDGVMIEAYPDVDTMDALLALATDSGADVTSGIRFTGSPACQMTLSSGAKVFTGSAANGDAVYAEVGAKDAVGSIYLNATNGYIYIQVANGGSEADWYKVTASNAD